MNQNDLRLRWLIRLRWAALAGQVVVISTCYGILRLQIPVLPLALILLAALLSQWFLWCSTRRPPKRGNILVGCVLALDVLILTATLYLIGGPHNPFTMLYLTQVAIAASLIGVRWTGALLGLVLICFAGLFWRHVPLPIPAITEEAICGVSPVKLHLAGMFVSLALTGGCLAWFVARLNAELWERKQLEREMDQISQIELHDVGDGLHEDLCQRLAGLAALGKLLESQLRSARTSESEVAGEITRELKQTLVLANQLADRLQPIAPLENGFLAAVNKLAAMTQAKFGTCCQVIDCGFPALLDRRLANNLFRVVQEALNNALSHPGATLIQIKLSSCDGSLRVEVTDDGIGMSDSGSSTGARLQVMRYCCELIEASLSLGRLMPHGTAVVVQLPER